MNVVRVDGKFILDPDNKTERRSDAKFLFVLQQTDQVICYSVFL